MPQPIKLGKINFSSVSLQENIQLSRIQDAINTLGGYSGEIELQNHINLSGHQIKNVAPPTHENDVVTSATAEAKYSAKALRPHLEGGGAFPLRTFLTALKGDVIASGPGSAQATIQALTGITIDEISGTLNLTQLPTSGLTGTVTLAALTVGGTQGSISFDHGLIVGFVNPT